MYYLKNIKVIGEYKNKKEAIQNRDNNIDFYPEEDFIVVDENNNKLT